MRIAKDVYGLPPVFRDSHGNAIKVGDKITIDGHYNYQHFVGKVAEIIWDSQHGMYKWTYTETRRKKTFTTEEDFYGVYKFTKIHPAV